MSDTWQPIETAPRDGKPFLAASANYIGVLKWRDDEWFDNGGIHEDECGEFFDVTQNGITHWMPLPEPPKE